MNSLSATEYSEWQIYLASGTMLERLIDSHLAQIAAILASAFRRKHSAPRKASQFLLLPPVPTPPMTGELMLAKMIAFTQALGGEIIDKRGWND